MTRIIKWLFIAFFLFGVLLGMLTVGSIEQHSIIDIPDEMTANELKQVKRFIEIHDPTQKKSGQTANSELNQQDVNLMLDYISQRIPGALNRRLYADIALHKKEAQLKASYLLPDNPLGKFINLAAKLVELDDSGQSIKLESFSIGGIKAPPFVAAAIAELIHRELKKSAAGYQLISESIKSIYFEEKKLKINYIWDTRTAETVKTQLSSLVISADLKQALIAHSKYLAELNNQLPSRPMLKHLLMPMFKYATERSIKNDPIIENQAVFISLGAYVLNKNIPRFLGEKEIINIKRKRIYLKGRNDLTKHFLLSAAITCMANSELAESIGLEKEIRDSKVGSGFSFADLAADHAGIELAKKSVKSESMARKIQLDMSSIESDKDYMLDVNNLPEGIKGKEFMQDYSTKDSVEYKKIESLIKAKIGELPVHRNVAVDD